METSRSFGFIGVVLLSLLASIFCACGGGGGGTGYVVPDRPYYPDTPYSYGNSGSNYYYGDSDYFYRDGYYYDQYGYYDQFGYYDGYGNLVYDNYDPAYTNIVNRNRNESDPFMQQYANISDRSVSQYVNSTYSGMLNDFGGSLDDLLIRVDDGEFYINPADYTIATRNVSLTEHDRLESSMLLKSSYNGVSLASFTLEEFFGTEQLANLKVEGSGSFGSTNRSGLYIGIRQFGDRDTRWFGPYRNGMEWEVSPLKWNERYVSKHCFVTLAVFGGDSVVINRLSARVNH